MTLPRTLELVQQARLSRPGGDLQLPQSRSCGTASSASCATRRGLGVAGLLLTDLPAGSDPGIEQQVQRSPLDLIRLVAPTTRPERLAAVGRRGAGIPLPRLAPGRHRGERHAGDRSRGVDRPGARRLAAADRGRVRHLDARSRRRGSAGWPTASSSAARWSIAWRRTAWPACANCSRACAAPSIARRRPA